MQEAIVFLVRFSWVGVFIYWIIGIMFYLDLEQMLNDLSHNFKIIEHDALDSVHKEMYENLARSNERLVWTPACICTLSFKWGKDAARLWLLKRYFETQMLFASERETP